MERLNYSTLEKQGLAKAVAKTGTEKILQFGEGNFLRAFVDYFVDVANEKTDFNAKVCVVQPIASGLANVLNEQQGLFTLYTRGMENGARVNEKRIISCISRALNPYEEYAEFLQTANNPELRYIVSNTTEAGIVFDDTCKLDDAPPASFPAKLTRLMYERFKNGGRGFVVLSCELIDSNGEELKRCVKEYTRLWQLGAEFENWLEQENLFCSTLVDRIVTGYPKAEAEQMNSTNGYEDRLLNTCEIFALWVIEGPKWLEEELPFKKAGLPVKVVADHSPYKKQKVRILNGAHTSMVPAAFLAGFDIVRDCMHDEVISAFMQKAIYEEIIPCLPLPKKEMEAFAAAVSERFANPFIDHSLLDISLNCTSKWAARVLPSVRDYYDKNGKLPACLTFSFAAYAAFYCGLKPVQSGFANNRCKNGANEEYLVRDDSAVIEFFTTNSGLAIDELIKKLCARHDFWGIDLNSLDGFYAEVCRYMALIEEKGSYEAIKACLQTK